MKVWVLGSKHQNADKSILWGEKFPNFADPDILIINLQSLTRDTLKGVNKEAYFFAKQTIFDKFIHGGTLIFITAPHPESVRQYLIMDSPIYEEVTGYKNDSPIFSVTQYPIDYLCPLEMETLDVPEGFDILYDNRNPYSSYLNKVGKFDMLLHNFSAGKLFLYMGIHPLKYEGVVKATSEPVYQITDKADRILGGAFHVYPHCRGTVVFLPPTTKISVDEGINKLLEVYGKTNPEEVVPEWVKDVPLHGLDDMNRIINELKIKKNDITHQLDVEYKKRQSRMNHYRLLFDTNKSLENAVREAFVILGFGEIRRTRSEGYEDGVIDFNTLTNYKHAVLEVKGVNKGIAKEDIAQCEGWVTDYEKSGLNVKGIFVPNQWRLKSYKTSKNERERLEFNLRRYAESREICVIPSSVLFEAVNQVLAGNMKNREGLEKLIAHTNGVVHSI